MTSPVTSNSPPSRTSIGWFLDPGSSSELEDTASLSDLRSISSFSSLDSIDRIPHKPSLNPIERKAALKAKERITTIAKHERATDLSDDESVTPLQKKIRGPKAVSSPSDLSLILLSGNLFTRNLRQRLGVPTIPDDVLYNPLITSEERFMPTFKALQARRFATPSFEEERLHIHYHEADKCFGLIENDKNDHFFLERIEIRQDTTGRIKILAHQRFLKNSVIGCYGGEVALIPKEEFKPAAHLIATAYPDFYIDTSKFQTFTSLIRRGAPSNATTFIYYGHKTAVPQIAILATRHILQNEEIILNG